MNPKRTLLRLLPAALLVGAAAAALAGGLAEHLTPAGIAQHRAAWIALAHAHPAASVISFVLLYAVLAGAGMPVSLLLSLTGGLVFGAELGGLAIVAAASLAALISYGVVRFAVADWVERRMTPGSRLHDLVEAMRARGFWVILSARLMPVMPFPLVNVACGVARAPVRQFALATVIGAVPSSFIYAGLGSGLGTSLSAGSISAAVRAPAVWLPLAALAALSLAPLVIRRGRAARA
jgi:uncharacterized membrane protein YdjX (TVP38/TMEM64 family)